MSDKVDFTCPICGSNEFEERRVRVGEPIIGGRSGSEIVGYQCVGCTVHFADPARFTSAVKKEES